MIDTAGMRSKKHDNLLNSMQSLRRIGSFGLMMGVLIMTGYYLGSYIDRQLETYPWFMMLLVILCIIGGFTKLFRDAGVLGDGQ